jgi:N-acyl homoserine lactone hydrolase
VVNFKTIIQGYPGKSPSHGGLGWSTVSLLTVGDERILVDCGSFGVRGTLLKNLKTLGITPESISTVLLTHLHWDHCVNWTLFPGATIMVGEMELEWALKQSTGSHQLPELYVEALASSSRLRVIVPGEEVLNNIVAYHVPGHTPGHLFYYISRERDDIIIAGDAGKTRTELTSGAADMTMDQDASKRSIQSLWDMWAVKPGTILVPGHDMPMVLKDSIPTYLSTRNVSIDSWFGDDLMSIRHFDIREPE